MKDLNGEARFFTVIQVARLMGMTRAAIYKKIKNGKLRVNMIEGRVMIPRDIVQVLVERNITEKVKAEIDKGIAKVMHDYGETLRMLGKE